MSWRLVIVYLCCAEVRCAHCALWWMQLREGGWWRRLPTAGAPPPSTQSVLSEAPDWGHQQGDHHPSLMCCVLYSCERFWRSINKVFSFQIQHILYSPIMMIKYHFFFLELHLITWQHACDHQMPTDIPNWCLNEWGFLLTLKNYLEHFGGYVVCVLCTAPRILISSHWYCK